MLLDGTYEGGKRDEGASTSMTWLAVLESQETTGNWFSDVLTANVKLEIATIVDFGPLQLAIPLDQIGRLVVGRGKSNVLAIGRGRRNSCASELGRAMSAKSTYDSGEAVLTSTPMLPLPVTGS